MIAWSLYSQSMPIVRRVHSAFIKGSDNICCSWWCREIERFSTLLALLFLEMARSSVIWDPSCSLWHHCNVCIAGVSFSHPMPSTAPYSVQELRYGPDGMIIQPMYDLRNLRKWSYHFIVCKVLNGGRNMIIIWPSTCPYEIITVPSELVLLCLPCYLPYCKYATLLDMFQYAYTNIW